MAKLTFTKTPALAPPTQQQLVDLKRNLNRCIFIEHSAALSGIPKRVLAEWLLRGRAGDPLFAEFIEMIDLNLAELSSTLMSPIVEAAASGNLAASTWLYNTRIRPYEERALKKQFEAEDVIDQRLAEVEAEQDLAGSDELAADVLRQMLVSNGSETSNSNDTPKDSQ